MIIAAPELRFDEAEHRYFLGAEELPSVTGVLRDAGLVDHTHCSEYARERGSMVHKAIHLELTVGLDWGTLSEALHPYVSAAIEFLTDYRAKTIQTEGRVVSVSQRYAGTDDWIGDLMGGEFSIVDWKTFFEPSPVTGFQTAGYADAIFEMTGHTVRRRYGIHLSRDGRYKVEEYASRDDLKVFRSALWIARTRKELGLI